MVDELILGSSLELPEAPTRKSTEYIKTYQGLIYSCVSRIAQEVSTIQLKLLKKKIIKGKIELEEVEEHEVLSLLYYANEFYTFSQLIFITEVYWQLTGEAFWVIFDTNDRKNPKQVWPLRPDWVDIIPSKTEFIDHYEYHPEGWAKGVRLEKEQIIFFKNHNPLNPYRGKGAVQASSMAIDTLDFLNNWNRNFFFNSAIPSIVFTTDKKLKSEEIKRFMSDWQNKYGGVSNANKVAFLGGGLKPEIISQSFKDMDFAVLKQSVKDDILASFGIPKTILGLTEDVNRATSSTAKQIFAENTIKPLMTSFVSYLNEYYLPLFEDKSDLFFDYEDPTPEDVELQLKIYENGLKNGWLTINEVRDEENREPIEGGDIIYLPFSLQPMGSPPPSFGNNIGEKIKGFFGKTDEKQEGYITLKAKRKKKRIKDILTLPIPPKRLSEIRKEQIMNNIKPDLIKMISVLMKYKEPEKSKEEQEKIGKQREAHWKQLVAKTDVWEAKYRQILWDYFQRQEKEVLQNIESLKSFPMMERKNKIDTAYFDLKEWDKVLEVQLRPYIKEIVNQQGGFTFHSLGLPQNLNLSTERAVRYLENVSLRFSEEVNQTTLVKLRESLAEGVKLEESINELRKRVNEIYGNASTARAEMIARSEVLRASNFATNEAYIQSGIVTGKEWLTAEDERTCPWCSSMNGKIVDVKSDFLKEGDDLTVNDKKLDLDYSDITTPPLHPQCRCTILPWLEEIETSQPLLPDVKETIEGNFYIPQTNQTEWLKTFYKKDNQPELAEYAEEFDFKIEEIDIDWMKRNVHFYTTFDAKTEKYFENMKDGDKFPPLIVIPDIQKGVEDSFGLLLWDGNRRFNALMKLKNINKFKILIGSWK